VSNLNIYFENFVFFLIMAPNIDLDIDKILSTQHVVLGT